MGIEARQDADQIQTVVRRSWNDSNVFTWYERFSGGQWEVFVDSGYRVATAAIQTYHRNIKQKVALTLEDLLRNIT